MSDNIQDAEFYPVNRFEIQTEPEELTSADKKVTSIQAALNDDPEAYLNVTRQTMGGNSPQEFVGRFPADKFDFGQLQVYLQQRHGGGDYRVMLYAKGKIRANKLISIAHEKEATNPGKLDENNALLAVLQRMDNMQRQMIEMMTQKTAQPSRQEFLQEMMMYKEIFNSGGNSSQQNPLSQLRDLIALQKELGLGGAPEEKEPGFGDLLEKLTPLVTAAVSQPRQQPPQRKKAENVNFLVKAGIAQLLNAAGKNGEPATYAEMIIDQFPQQVITQIITRPNAVESLAVMEPKILAHKQWFADLIEHIKAQLGMPSKFEGLYSDSDGDSVAENGANDTEHGDLQTSDD